MLNIKIWMIPCMYMNRYHPKIQNKNLAENAEATVEI